MHSRKHVRRSSRSPTRVFGEDDSTAPLFVGRVRPVPDPRGPIEGA